MRKRAAMLGTVLSCIVQAAMAQTSCVGANASAPAGANTTDKSAPFFVDPTGLDLKTAPPTRDPSNPNYPRGAELPDGTLPPAGATGNFIIGPTHTAAPETVAQDTVPHGTIHSFTLSSKDSVIYNPGVIRDDPPNCPDGSVRTAQTAPGDPSHLILTTTHPGSWRRTVDVFVPAQYIRGTEAPFIVFGDAGATGSYPGRDLFTVLDNLIQQRRVPPMIAIGIGAGGQNSSGSERGREDHTVSGSYAEWLASGAAAFTMAWFHPELYHRVLAYSPTFVNQQWPYSPWLRGGAWEYHSEWAGPPSPKLEVAANTVTPSDAPSTSPLVPNSPVKPIRFWFEVGDQDLFYPTAGMADGMHDWVLGNERMARVLADKGYAYQVVLASNAKHVDRPTVAQTLPSALEWLWKGYPTP